MIAIAKFIGVKGFIIIGLGIALSVQGAMIHFKNKEIAELDVTLRETEDKLIICFDRINEQNAAIKEAGKKKEELDKELNQVADKNRELSAKNRKLQEDLSKKPLALTCPNQIQELRELGVKMKEWNK